MVRINSHESSTAQKEICAAVLKPSNWVTRGGKTILLYVCILSQRRNETNFRKVVFQFNHTHMRHENSI